MPVSDVQICNLALASIGGTAQLQSLSQKTNEAVKCSLELDPAIRQFLRDIDWGSARKRRVISAMSDAPEFGWSYQYEIGNDVLAVRSIGDAYVGGPNYYAIAPHEMGRTQDGRNVILTNVGPTVNLIYTSIIPITQFDDGMVEGFRYLLASMLADSIRNDKSKSAELMQKYSIWKAQAMGESLMDGTAPCVPGSGFQNARTNTWQW